MKLRLSPTATRFAIAGACVYAVIWGVITFAMVAGSRPDLGFFLIPVTMPAITVVVHIVGPICTFIPACSSSPGGGAMMMMAAVLIAGLLQYAMVGYFIGWLIEKLFGESAGSMPAPPRG